MKILVSKGVGELFFIKILDSLIPIHLNVATIAILTIISLIRKLIRLNIILLDIGKTKKGR